MRKYILIVAGILVISSELEARAFQQAGDADQNAVIVLPENIPDARVIPPNAAIVDFQIQDGFEVQLVAAEPDIVDPVAITFDEDGAIWAVEMRGYMPTISGEGESDPVGRIVVLRDLDGDGFFETSSVFMDSLVLPRAIAVYAGGVLVAEPPNLLFIERNGYEAGDITIVDREFAIGGNPEHQPNGLLLAMDNWIYNAKSDQRYRYRGGEWEKEKTEYRGQWGISQDNWGRLFYNDNSQVLRGDEFMPNLVSSNPHRAPAKLNAYGSIRTSNRVYPRRVNPGVNRAYRPETLDETGRLVNVTSAAGPVIYRGDNFPRRFNGDAFVSETAGNLVMRVAMRDSAGIVIGAAPYVNDEYLTATDERFRPVNGYSAPDGSLYIVDMYRGVIQHVTYLTDYLKRQIADRNLALPLGLGRIYRMKWSNATLSQGPRLSEATNSDLVGHLDHPNGWWRDTAQRLLIERSAVGEKSALWAVALDDNAPISQLHALWTLEGLGLLSPADLQAAADVSSNPKVLGSIAHLGVIIRGIQTDEALAVMASISVDAVPETAVYVAAAASRIEPGSSDAAWRLQIRLHEQFPDDIRLVDVIVGALEDREAEFLDLAESVGLTDGNLFQAVSSAAGMALVQPAALVELFPNLDARKISRGKSLYLTICAACHGADGGGLASTAPPLVRSQWVLQDPDRLIRLVLDGMDGPVEVDGVRYSSPDIQPVMPGVRTTQMSDEDIAAILSFIRTQLGPQSTQVTTEDVRRVRAESSSGAIHNTQSLKSSEDGWTSLFDGNTLDGWTQINGSATYEVRDGTIVGRTVHNSPNSFLATDRMYGDFILELEFKVDPSMNSGIQIRSTSDPEIMRGRVHGYQVEIDPSDRAWTGGLYDEGRRGWLFDLRGTPAAQKAFKQNEWNHFRIEAHGSHIRTWLNGVLATDMIDTMTDEGIIALQVHGISSDATAGTEIRWRNLRIKSEK
ncbi:MAG: DUF1080 domain-containing protein [Bacteroidetes bacterium]|nr:MAG: DUF1080 domain-containing protein [Bacteroidota bacterium]